MVPFEGERARFAKELLTPLLPRLRRAQHLLRNAVVKPRTQSDGERDGTPGDPRVVTLPRSFTDAPAASWTLHD